ncbi:MAG: hypothetical protein JKY48_13085 [Flavobacteriales bacterium]|nr:hypothetical protein [Flavobacteriales bacterium]
MATPYDFQGMKRVNCYFFKCFFKQANKSGADKMDKPYSRDRKAGVAVVGVLLAASVLTACGGGGGGSGAILPVVGGGDNDTPGTVTSSGEFDLADYFFHNNLDMPGGSLTFEQRTFFQETGEEFPFSITNQLVREGDTITLSASTQLPGTEEPRVARVYTITSSTIERTFFNLDGEVGRSDSGQRFVDIGETYLDMNTSTNFGTDEETGEEAILLTNVKCSLVEHFDTFDLSLATGQFNLASGVFNDVVQINCVVRAIDPDTGEVIVMGILTEIDQYFDRDVGTVFIDESISFFLGATYTTIER